MLGVALEVPEDALQNVCQNHGADPDTMKLLIMIDHWLLQLNADWATLIKVTEDPLVNNLKLLLTFVNLTESIDM